MANAIHADILDAIARAARSWAPDAVVRDARLVPGGHSGITLRATLEAPTKEPADVVFKVCPPQRPAIGRHDVLRQAAILEGLAHVPGLAVPAIVLRSAGTPNLFGMTYVAGESAEPVLDGPNLEPAEADRRARSAARMLAVLHSAPRDVEVLRGEPILSVGEELQRWHRTMQAVPEELRPHERALHSALLTSLPEPMNSVVVHGDYRLGNTLCANGVVRAVIDWEIWSLGDPRIDLGWFRLFCSADNFPGASTPAVGIPGEHELLREYEATTGAQMPEIGWFDAFASYKMAAIMGHNLHRHRTGRHHDPYQESLVPTILSLVDHGLQIVQTTSAA